MGAVVFILLFFLGILISTIGGIIGIVDAFRVSALWGVLALLVPFALLIFCIKFWNQRKWARNSLIMSLIGLGTALLSIPLIGRLAMFTAGDTVDQELEDFTFEEAPTDPNAQFNTEDSVVGDPGEEEAQLFEEAILPGLPTAAEIARAELLPSTDPNERIKEINSERADPYAIVTLPPPIPATPPAPETPPDGQPTDTANQPNANQGLDNVTPGEGPGGDGLPTDSLPELPEPTVIASQVEISGIAAVNGDTYVIVKAPGEPTSRYVKIGDRISNGTVLVKRIENRLGTSPIVILEERGEEIALPVGSNVGASQESAAIRPNQGSPIATLPIPDLN